VAIESGAGRGAYLPDDAYRDVGVAVESDPAALLNQADQLSNVGLVIIDEEQRFGVKQKEKLKELSKKYNELKEIIETADKLEQVARQYEETKNIFNRETDPEILAMAQKEADELGNKKTTVRSVKFRAPRFFARKFNYLNNTAKANVSVLNNLMSTCKDGPAVSLNGSPTVSPVTAA